MSIEKNLLSHQSELPPLTRDDVIKVMEDVEQRQEEERRLTEITVTNEAAFEKALKSLRREEHAVFTRGQWWHKPLLRRAQRRLDETADAHLKPSAHGHVVMAVVSVIPDRTHLGSTRTNFRLLIPGDERFITWQAHTTAPQDRPDPSSLDSVCRHLRTVVQVGVIRQVSRTEWTVELEVQS